MRDFSMPSSKWLIGALVLSLVANLVLAGFLLGRTTTYAAPARMGPDPAAMYFRALGFLPEERREQLMPIVRKHMVEIRPEIRETRRHIRGMFEVLVAEPFDAEAMRAQLAELRRLHAITQTESHASFVELLSEMSPEERLAMADALRRGSPFGRGNGPDRRHEHGPGRGEPTLAADREDDL
jgi:uncharacterized membrane protein